MKKKWMAALLAGILLVSLAACGAGEETTLTGMIVSVDGTKVTLMEMDMSAMGSFEGGQAPQMPGGVEGFQGFGEFNPEDFTGEFPEGGNFPQWGNGEMPEGGNFPQWGNGEMPEGMTPPDGMTPPEGATMPDFSGENGGMGSAFGSFAQDAETKELDIGDAHISVEIDGGKASGSMEDLQSGTFVTVTMNGKGKVTNVLVSSMSGFGGRRPGN